MNLIILTYEIEKTNIYSWGIMWKEMWDEWMNEWDLSQAKTSATDNRLQSQTKCLTFNPKIYYCETAKEWNMLMRTKIRSIYL